MLSYLGEEEPAGRLRKWIDLSAERWGVSEPLLADFLDGVLVIPLLLAGIIQKDDLLEGETILLALLACALREELSDLFVSKGWALRYADALLLPDVLIFNAPACAPALARVARAMGKDNQPEDVIEAVQQLNATLHLPSTLSELGVSEQLIPYMA